MAFFRTHYAKDEEYILDLFQDSCIVLFKNINHGKLTEERLTCALSTYFLSIGKYTMMAKDRKYKEIVDDEELSSVLSIEDDAEEVAETRTVLTFSEKLDKARMLAMLLRTGRADYFKTSENKEYTNNQISLFDMVG